MSVMPRKVSLDEAHESCTKQEVPISLSFSFEVNVLDVEVDFSNERTWIGIDQQGRKQRGRRRSSRWPTWR